MSVTFGQCRLCPKNSKPRRLYGSGVCAYHLSNPGHDQSKDPAEIKAQLQSDIDEKALKVFYHEQLKLVPWNRCENCGGKIMIPSALPKKTAVCHILPKNIFRSVMVHPENRWFACWLCHQEYDSSWISASQMPVWRVCVERFQNFMKLIKDKELGKLPDAFRVIMESVG